MPAGFFPQGEIQVFLSHRRQGTQWDYLGTCVASPQVRTQYVYKDVPSERVQPGPYMKMLATEQHHIAMVLNRVNHKTLNSIRTVGSPSITGGDFVRSVPAGRIVTGSTDFQLFLRYLLPGLAANGDLIGFLPEAAVFPPPSGASVGRLYYSATLLSVEEDAPSRVQELSLLVECNPFPIGKQLLLYSERLADFPATVTFD